MRGLCAGGGSRIPGPIWVVLHDHGNIIGPDSVFQLDDASGTPVTITPTELNTWLTTLEAGLRPRPACQPARRH